MKTERRLRKRMLVRGEITKDNGYYRIPLCIGPHLFDEIRVEMVRRGVKDAAMMTSEIFIRGLQQMQSEKTADQQSFKPP